MKKIWVVFLLLSTALPVWAQNSMKLGYIDVQRVISESHAGKSAKEKFQREVKKIESDLLKEKQELERLKSEMDKKALLLNEKERRNLERNLQRRVRNYQRSMRDSQEELRQRESEMTAEILKDLQKLIAEFAKKEKFTLIMGSDQFLYADKSVDLTDRVIELYDRRTGRKAKKHQ